MLDASFKLWLNLTTAEIFALTKIGRYTKETKYHYIENTESWSGI
jgi:hypothetical protein